MQETRDPVDGVLRTLAQQNWTPGDHEGRLEEALMSEFARAGRSSHLADHRAFWVGGLMLLACGAGVAATGGREVVRRLLIQVHLVDSESSIFEGDISPIPGTGDYQTSIMLADGRHAELHVRVEDHVGVEGMRQVTVQIPGNGTEAPADAGAAKMLQLTFDESARSVEPTVVDKIAEPERRLDWTDAEGHTHALFLVRNAGGDEAKAGFRLFREQEDGSYLQVGEVRTLANERMEVQDIEVGVDGYVTLTLQGVDGKRTTASLDAGSKSGLR
jgi:hypothetical protein